ncbi:myelin-oligodendrocyte glycoprotein-like isoform X2 [Phasianus colchicus]|uniref:myelin-oligodendrocyte glycoprotein-like isoform X2 n=1 Tax=Phasianus colchicus TaxID=9054 RepID=UPI00129DC7CB|nr:myelin-oligodendrocyte glycoprotein-like isoform X2 [Phasianus colchicus]
MERVILGRISSLLHLQHTSSVGSHPHKSFPTPSCSLSSAFTWDGAHTNSLCATHSCSHHLTISPCPSHCPAQFNVVAPSLHVTAIVGQDVVLHCQLSPCKDAWRSDIRWIQQRSSGFVHHYRDGEDLEQMAEYKGRTELLRNGLSDGNLDLRISAVRSSDSGSYSCVVQDGDNRGEAVVNLEVSDPFSQIIYPWKVALAVVITLLLGLFGITIFLYKKQERNFDRLELRAWRAEKRSEDLKDLVTVIEAFYEKMERMEAKVEKLTADMVQQREESEKHGEETVVETEESEELSEELD